MVPEKGHGVLNAGATFVLVFARWHYRECLTNILLVNAVVDFPALHTVEALDDDRYLVFEPHYTRFDRSQAQTTGEVETKVLVLGKPPKLLRGRFEYSVGRSSTCRSSPSRSFFKKGNLWLRACKAELSRSSARRSRDSLLANGSQFVRDLGFR